MMVGGGDGNDDDDADGDGDHDDDDGDGDIDDSGGHSPRSWKPAREYWTLTPGR